MLTFDGMEVDAFGLTDVGKVRKENQDQFLVAALHKVIEVAHTSLPDQYQHRFGSRARALMLLVADGVGGSAGGERASSVTLDAIVKYVANSMRCFYKLDDQASADLLHELALSVQQSHAAVRSEAAADPTVASMATTLTMAHILWPRAYIVQIGDSRCYLLRAGELTQVTQDQTVAQFLVDEGALSPEEAERSPLGHVLAQAIGGEDEVQPAISKVDLAPGDAMLLCTDGLTRHVERDDMARLAVGPESSERACRVLVDAALDGGGKDNITVVLARFR